LYEIQVGKFLYLNKSLSFQIQNIFNDEKNCCVLIIRPTYYSPARLAMIFGRALMQWEEQQQPGQR
jgi:hypothetical protein